MGLIIHRRGNPTGLFGATKGKTEEQYNLIQREGLSWWRNFTAMSRPKFDGTMIDVFWMCDDTDDKAGVKPHVPYYLLRRAIKAVLSDTAATCRELPLPPKRYVDEAAVLLEGLIESVYIDMDRLERLMRRLPKAGPDLRRWEIQQGTRKLKEYLKEQAAAAVLLAGGDDNSNSSETKSLPVLLKEIQAFVRVPAHRQELKDAVNRARKEQPTIINWLRSYIYRALEAIGVRPDEDKLPAHSLDDAEGLLLDRVLIAAVHDFLSEPDVGRIAFDLNSGSDFDVDAHEIVHALESEASNGALLPRAWDAFDTVKQNATSGAVGRLGMTNSTHRMDLTGVIALLRQLTETKQGYFAKYPNEPFSGARNSNGREVWKRSVQPIIHQIELELDAINLDLVTLGASLSGLWPIQWRSPADWPTWRDALDIIKNQENPKNMDAVIQGFQRLQVRMDRIATPGPLVGSQRSDATPPAAPGSGDQGGTSPNGQPVPAGPLAATPAADKARENGTGAGGDGKERPPNTENVFQKEGDTWTVGYEQHTVHGIRHLDGMTYIHHLLSVPNRDVWATQLYQIAHPEQPESNNGDTDQEKADADYLRECNAEMGRLRDEIEKARGQGDVAGEQAAQEQFDRLREDIATITKPGARGQESQSFSTRTSRISNTVCKRIGDAIKRLSDHHPALATYLDKTIKTGKCCQYVCPTPISWTL